MHSFAIDVKGGEGRRIFPSIIKGEIVGHRFSLMSIWKYSRGGDREYRSREEQKEPRGADQIGGATYIRARGAISKECQSKRSHVGGVPAQEEPSEELSEHIKARGAI